MNRIITTTITIFLAVGVCLAESPQTKSKNTSLRVTLGSAPGVEKGKSSGVVSASGPIGDDGGARLEIMGIKRSWSESNPDIGGMFGAGLFIGGNKGEDEGSSIDILPIGGIFQGGVVYKAHDTLIFEAGPYVGLGIAVTDTVIEGVGEFTNQTGPYVLYGIKGGVLFQVSASVELGFELGYEGFSMEQEYEYLGSTFDATYSGHGGRISGVLGIKF